MMIAGALAVSVLAAGCTTTEQRVAQSAGVGAVAGAIIGGAVTGTGRGALAGAAIGGASGALIGAATRPGYCRYKNSRGVIYEAPCR
jgi:hypothetical protein